MLEQVNGGSIKQLRKGRRVSEGDDKCLEEVCTYRDKVLVLRNGLAKR
jgi:hypothetical protein